MVEAKGRKICLITPSIHMGGMQRAMVNLANEFANHNFEVVLISIYKLEIFFKLDKRIKFIEPKEGVENLNKIARLIYTINHIANSVDKANCKKVIVFGRFYSMITMLALTNKNKDIYISDRASFEYRDYWYLEIISKVLTFFYKPKGIIAQTNDSAKFQKNKFGSKVAIRVIPNPVKELNLTNNIKRKYVLAIGRFGDSLKGFDRLIEAWCISQTQDWKLVFAGGSKEDAFYDGYIAELSKFNKLDTVTFLGKVKDIDLLLSQSQIFVIPSRSEGFPNSLLEAMAAKICCISFNFNSGPSDLIINNVNGVLVENGNIMELKYAIEKCINDEEFRVKISINNDYLDKYSKHNIIKEYIELIWPKVV